MAASFFVFTTTAATKIYTLSLHDALPILAARLDGGDDLGGKSAAELRVPILVYIFHPSASRPPSLASATPARLGGRDRKSTRLNSSHMSISYAVFCLKKKKHKNLTRSQ